MKRNCRLVRAGLAFIADCGVLLLLMVVTGHSARARAQNIELKSGQIVETTGVHRVGDNIMGKIMVGASPGEIGYPITAIARIDFAEPAALQTARELLSQGQPEKALTQIEPVVKYYEPFKMIPGAWWAPAALVKVSAFAGLKKDIDAEVLAKEIRSTVSDPDISRAAELRLAAGFIRREQFEKAIQICDAAIHESTDESVLAEAWTRKGDALTAQRRWDDALAAYLHVPIFYQDEKLFLPSAILGSARSYRRLDDNEHARRAFNELISSFPKSAEASVAQKELQKIPK